LELDPILRTLGVREIANGYGKSKMNVVKNNQENHDQTPDAIESHIEEPPNKSLSDYPSREEFLLQEHSFLRGVINACGAEITKIEKSLVVISAGYYTYFLSADNASFLTKFGSIVWAIPIFITTVGIVRIVALRNRIKQHDDYAVRLEGMLTGEAIGWVSHYRDNYGYLDFFAISRFVMLIAILGVNVIVAIVEIYLINPQP